RPALFGNVAGPPPPPRGFGPPPPLFDRHGGQTVRFRRQRRPHSLREGSPSFPADAGAPRGNTDLAPARPPRVPAGCAPSPPPRPAPCAQETSPRRQNRSAHSIRKGPRPHGQVSLRNTRRLPERRPDDGRLVGGLW